MQRFVLRINFLRLWLRWTHSLALVRHSGGICWLTTLWHIKAEDFTQHQLVANKGSDELSTTVVLNAADGAHLLDDELCSGEEVDEFPGVTDMKDVRSKYQGNKADEHAAMTG